MSDRFYSQVLDHLEGLADDSNKRHPFYLYEPWDVGERPDWIIEKSKEDGTYDTLYHPDFQAVLSKGKFQSGFLESKSFFRVMLGGTQIGKSFPVYIEVPIMLTGEIPFSMRHPKGYDTGILREVNEENIRRWGRWDIKTGELLDHNWRAKKDLSRWNCGTIKGAGVYPKEKIAPPGEVVWIGTYLKALEQYWWPRFKGGKRIFPEEFIDTKSGNKGFSETTKTVHFPEGRRLCFITYETGYNRFEAEKAWMVYLDEEPDDERIIPAAQSHTKKGWALIETPYRGITYTQNLIFRKSTTKEKEVFHACQYDSPYQTEEIIHNTRVNLKPWEVDARVWGLHSEVRGRPFYDREKIANWRRRFAKQYSLKEFVATDEYYGMNGDPHVTNLPGLLKVECAALPRPVENEQTVWRVYEDYKEEGGYLLTADPAEGAENPEDAKDKCSALITRWPTDEEKRKGIDEPILVASIRSTLETVEFAKMCSYAARYYNNALICAETRRAAANATFYITIKDWPNWYRMVKISRENMEATKEVGFDTNVKTRPMLFDLVGEWIKGKDADSHPGFLDEFLMREMEACIVGKKGRPDHQKDGYLDTTICFGLSLYTYKYANWQVRPGEKKSGNGKPSWYNAAQKSQRPEVGKRWLGYSPDLR